MSFDGSGTFNRTNGTNTGTTLWGDDRDGGTKIVAGRHDSHDQNLADGLTNCITKDGQTTVTANIPMNSKKFTGLAIGSAAAESTTLAQLQDSATIWGGTAAGSGDALTITLTPALTAYANGQRFTLITAAASTTASTLNVDSLGAKSIKMPDGSATVAESIESGQLLELIYDGTNFRIINVNETTESWTPTITAGGSMTFTGQTVLASAIFRKSNIVSFQLAVDGTIGGTPSSTLVIPMPYGTVAGGGDTICGINSNNDNGTYNTGPLIRASSTTIAVYNETRTSWTAGAARFYSQGWYTVG